MGPLAAFFTRAKTAVDANFRNHVAGTGIDRISINQLRSILDRTADRNRQTLVFSCVANGGAVDRTVDGEVPAMIRHFDYLRQDTAWHPKRIVDIEFRACAAKTGKLNGG